MFKNLLWNLHFLFKGLKPIFAKSKEVKEIASKFIMINTDVSMINNKIVFG